jgi:hypothetical protein
VNDSICPGSLEINTRQIGQKVDSPGRESDLDDRVRLAEVIDRHTQRFHRRAKRDDRSPNPRAVGGIPVDP